LAVPLLGASTATHEHDQQLSDSAISNDAPKSGVRADKNLPYM